MSFRIDDILKKDDKIGPNMMNKQFGDDCMASSSQDSILLQTLMSRNQYPYYHRSLSEPMGKIYSGASNWHDRDRLYSSYCDLYADKAIAYSNMYMRNRLWTPYNSALPMMLLPHYSHYSKRKGGQVRFTANQTDALEKRFISHKYLSPEDRRLLAESLKLTDRQVKTWFQNRRAKWRRSNSSSSNPDSDVHEKLDSDSDEDNVKVI